MGMRARRPQEGQGHPPPSPSGDGGWPCPVLSQVRHQETPGGGHVLVTSLIAFPEVRDPPPAHSHGPRSLHTAPPEQP